MNLLQEEVYTLKEKIASTESEHRRETEAARQKVGRGVLNLAGQRCKEVNQCVNELSKLDEVISANFTTSKCSIVILKS